MAEYLPDRIFADTGAVKALAAGVETPFYLYDRQGIEDAVQSLHREFSWMSGYQNFFPLRENINPHILKLLQRHGSGVSVCSYLELQLAQECGFAGDQLLYEPTEADDRAERLALSLDAVWLINGNRMLPDPLPRRILLRYQPVDQRFTPQQRRHMAKNKHGFTRAKLLELLPKLKAQGAEELGLALQLTAYHFSVGLWQQKTAMLLRLAKEVHETHGITIKHCYVGEGMGLPYHPSDKGYDLQREIQLVHDAYADWEPADRPTLYTGLTKPLLDPHGLLITRIIEKRQIARSFLVVDAGVSQYVRPALRSAYRHISILGRSQCEDRWRYSVVGRLPEQFDALEKGGRMLPQVDVGELCVIHDVGCGGRSMPLLYGFQPLAAEYLYEPDGTIRCIAKGRTAEECLDYLRTW